MITSHFVLYIINLLSWVGVGLLIGRSISRKIKRAKNSVVFTAAASSLITGIFFSLTHGTWLGFGIDFFNIASAAVSAIINLYILEPKTRPVIANLELWTRIKELVGTVGSKNPQSFFPQNFLKNITSTINPSQR